METNLVDQTNTSLLIEYLEATIADEMVLNSFIRGIKLKQLDKSSITLSVSNYATRDILTSSYKKVIQSAADQIFERKMDIQFLVFGEEEVLEKSKKKKKIATGKNISEKLTFDNYVEAAFNSEAVDISKKLRANMGKFSPLFITAHSGLGKTHLLHAIGNDFVKNGLSAAYIEPNSFTRTIRQLSQEKGDAISEFIDSMKKYDVILFDDIQYMGDRQVTLKVLFNIINTHAEDGKQIVLVADKPPQELSGFEDRFITRFVSGLSTSIKFPEIECLIKVLKFKLNKEGMKPHKWEKEALRFVARNNSSSIRAIEGAVKRVAFFTMTESSIKYTHSVITSIFKELTIDPKELTHQRVVATVGKYYKISKGDLLGKSKKANIVVARHMCMWLIRKVLKLPYAEIGKIFKRDHSTIISAVQNIETKMKINEAVKIAASKIEGNINSVS